jgi:arginase
MTVMDLNAVRKAGAKAAAANAVGKLAGGERQGFWIHLDVDVLDDAVMPAVDYRMTDGLDFDELVAVLQAAVGSGRAVGLNVTIFNPNLDPNRVVARNLVGALAKGLNA